SPRALLVALRQQRGAGERPLPAGRLEDLARFCADPEHGRSRLGGEGLTQRSGQAMDERAGRRVVLLALDVERRPAGDDDVELLSAVLLAMLFDDALAGFRSGVGVDAEGADVELPSDRPPGQALLALDREGLQLADVHDPSAHVCLLSSSSTTGSMRSTPSTRSSRFSFADQVKKASPSSPSKPRRASRSRSSAASSSSTSSQSLSGVLPKIARWSPYSR